MSSIQRRVRDVLPTVAVLFCLAACTTTTTITDFDEAPGRDGGSRQDGSRGDDDAAPRYTVQKGDTLYAIAFRNRIDLRELISWNGLSEPYTIYPGQDLRIGDAPPARSAPSRAERDSRDSRVARRDDSEAAPRQRDDPPAAPDQPRRVALGRLPVAEAPPARASRNESAADAARARVNDGRDTYASRGEDASSGQGGSVQPGRDRTSAGSREDGTSDRNAMPVSELAAVPIATDDPIREARDDSASTPPADSGDRDATRPVPPTASRSVPVASAATVIPATPVEPDRDVGPIRPARTRMAGGIGWRWPSSATLVGRFSADDDARQGIRLQGPAGSPVTASADGEVVYSGNGLVGLGELVIIKHGPEYLSAYGLNRKRLVTEGQQVKAGHPVAEMGNTAGVAGLLHFEVRRNGRPIDPLTVLPPR